MRLFTHGTVTAIFEGEQYYFFSLHPLRIIVDGKRYIRLKRFKSYTI
jgi:hypothetical protein